MGRGRSFVEVEGKGKQQGGFEGGGEGGRVVSGEGGKVGRRWQGGRGQVGDKNDTMLSKIACSLSFHVP